MSQQQEQASPPPEPQQDPEYIDEGIFTTGDNAPDEIANAEAAWAVYPMPMEPIRVQASRQITNAVIVSPPHREGYYRPEHSSANVKTPSLLDYAELYSLSIDLESERWRKIANIVIYHGVGFNEKRNGTLSANMKAAKLIQEWLTEEEQNELLKNGRVKIKSKKYNDKHYVVYQEAMEKVEVWQGSKITMKCCGIVAESGYVDGDKFLAKVMAIKTDEDDYVKRSAVMPG